MSYILDALRRAESERERERGQVPGLNAQPVPAGVGGEAPESRRALGRRGVFGVAAAVLLLGAIVWWWSRPPTARPTMAPEREAAAPIAADAQRPETTPPAPMPALPAAAAAASVAAGPALLVAPPLPPPPPAAPVRAARPMATAAPTEAAPGIAPVPPAPSASAPATASASASVSATATKPTLLSELTPAQRAELPQMAIGGAIYSDQPSSRFVVINGQVVREGETAAPGVVLERIGPKSALIRWRQTRIELPI